MKQLHLFDSFKYQKIISRAAQMTTKKVEEEVKGTTVLSVHGRNFAKEDQEKQVGVKVLNRSGGGHLNIDRSEISQPLPPK